MDRKLIATLAADVAGYKRLVERDERGTITRLQSLLAQVVRPGVSKHGGRIVKLMGDGMLSQFESALDAVQCAVDIQNRLADLDPDLKLRIGVHLGDATMPGQNIAGDGLNTTARLGSLAEPGGIVVSRQIRDQVVMHGFDNLVPNGSHQSRNIAHPIETFSLMPAQDSPSGSGALRFDGFELNPAEFTLQKDGEAVHVEPLVFDFLRFIVANAGHTVTRDSAIEEVWQGRIVSDATIASCVKAARKALGDDGETQKYIKTIRGRGFRFEGALDTGDSSPTPRTAPPPTTPDDGRRSLAVLPFRALQTDGALQNLAGALSDSLATVLTRIPMLAVLSTSAVEQAPTGPDASFLVEGSLRNIEGEFQADIRLVHRQSGLQIWGQQFSRPDRGDPRQALLFDILARLEPRLIQAILNDLNQSNAADTSTALLLKSLGLLAIKGWRRETFEEAADMLRRSISLKPSNPYAHSHLALILALGHRFGALPQTDAIAGEALAEAEIALEQDSEDSTVVSISACAIADVGQTRRAVPLLRKAIELNPNNAHAWAALGSAQMMLKKNRDAIQSLEKGVALAPLDTRLAVWLAVLSIVHLLDHNPDRAREVAEDACQQDDRNHLPRLALTAVQLARRDPDAANSACQDLLRARPDLSQNEVFSFLGKNLGAPVLALCDTLGPPRPA